MPPVDMVIVSLVPTNLAAVRLETAWTTESDPAEFIAMARGHFRAKDVRFMLNGKFAVLLSQLCTLMTKADVRRDISDG